MHNGLIFLEANPLAKAFCLKCRAGIAAKVMSLNLIIMAS